jgi:hypothetical protein
LTPAKPNFNLIIGEAVHAGLEAWFGGKGSADAVSREAGKSLKKNMPEGMTAEEEQQFAHADIVVRAMLDGYMQYWKDDKKQLTVMAVEFPFEGIRIAPGVRVSGRIDMLCTDSHSRALVFDHKTKSAIGEGYLLALPLSYQTALYPAAIERLYGERIHSVVYDIIRKSALRQGKAESAQQFFQRVREGYLSQPESYFLRQPIRLTPRRCRAAKEALVGLARVARVSYLHKDDRSYWPMTPANCAQFGTCEFLPLCLRGDRPDTLMFYRKREGA